VFLTRQRSDTAGSCEHIDVRRKVAGAGVGDSVGEAVSPGVGLVTGVGEFEGAGVWLGATVGEVLGAAVAVAVGVGLVPLQAPK
jgi:hypothetical protein